MLDARSSLNMFRSKTGDFWGPTTAKVPDGWARWDAAARWALLGALVLSTALIAQNIAQAAFWRDDDLQYAIPKLMDMRVRDEGRWLNYLLYPLIRHFNGLWAWWIGFLCTFFFFFRVSRPYVSDGRLAFAVALMGLQYPGFYAQSLWPVFCLPGAMVLAFAAAWGHRLPLPLFFAVFGCLLLGSNTQLYFFLPLLFLGPGSLSVNAPWKKSAQGVALWILGFVIGFGFASGMNILLVGQWGIQLASWRAINPIVDLVSALENGATRLEHAQLHLEALLAGDRWIWLLPATLWMVGFQVRVGRGRWLLAASCVLVLMASAIYGVTLYHGIWIDYRTTHALFLGGLFLFLLPSVGHRAQSFYCWAVFALFVAPMSWQSEAETRWFARVSGVMAEDLKQLDLPETARLIVDAQDLDAYSQGVETRAGLAPPLFMQRLDGWFRWRGCASSLGFTEVIWCRTKPGEWSDSEPALCEEKLSPYEAAVRSLSPGAKIDVLEVSEQEAVIRMRPLPERPSPQE